MKRYSFIFFGCVYHILQGMSEYPDRQIFSAIRALEKKAYSINNGNISFKDHHDGVSQHIMSLKVFEHEIDVLVRLSEKLKKAGQKPLFIPEAEWEHFKHMPDYFKKYKSKRPQVRAQ